MTLKTSIRTRLFISTLLCLLPLYGIFIYLLSTRYDAVVALLKSGHPYFPHTAVSSSVCLLLGGMMLPLGMAFCLARCFTEPLKQLIVGSEKIGRGDFSYRAVVSSGDELEVLADTINRMANDLAERETTIRDNSLELQQANSHLSQMNRELERLVAERTAELQLEKHWLETILTGLVEGLLVFDVSGKLIMANPAARSILNLPPHGRADGDIVRCAMPERFRRHLEDICSGRTTGSCEDELETQGKRVMVVVSPLTGVAAELSGVIVTLRDVSMDVSIDELKRDFISKISHELKTPLTSIRGALHFMLEHNQGIGATEQDLLQVCYRNTERLMRLISDILDLSKMEAGKMAYRFTPQSARQVAALACEEIGAYALEHGIRLDNRIGSSFPLICGDSDRLVQVISNLLSNAIKFSPPDTRIVITAELLGEMAEINVIDEGEPIQWLDRERLFRRFQQLDSPQSYRAGTGLGLAICKEIVERHEGRISYAPAGITGNRFAFTLPLWLEAGQTCEETG